MISTRNHNYWLFLNNLLHLFPSSNNKIIPIINTWLIESKQSSYIYIQLKAEGTKTLFRVGNEERIFTNILSDKTGCIAALDRIPIGLKLYMQGIDHPRVEKNQVCIIIMLVNFHCGLIPSILLFLFHFTKWAPQFPTKTFLAR